VELTAHSAGFVEVRGVIACGPQLSGSVRRPDTQRENDAAFLLSTMSTPFPLREGKKEQTMAERLGLGVIPGVGWRAHEVQTIARQAEEAGFDTICAAEVNNDVMATVQLMGTATTRITVATWIANIYLRPPYVCAQGAACIADAIGGRFILGLGVSHQPVNRALGAGSCSTRGDASAPAASSTAAGPPARALVQGV
jgi:hypothetical protein